MAHSDRFLQFKTSIENKAVSNEDFNKLVSYCLATKQSDIPDYVTNFLTPSILLSRYFILLVRHQNISNAVSELQLLV